MIKKAVIDEKVGQIIAISTLGGILYKPYSMVQRKMENKKAKVQENALNLFGSHSAI